MSHHVSKGQSRQKPPQSDQHASATPRKRKPSPAERAETERRRQERLLMRCMIYSLQRMEAWHELDECMSGNSFHSTHIKRNNLDQWEMRYAMARHCLQIPTSAYEARTSASPEWGQDGQSPREPSALW